MNTLRLATLVRKKGRNYVIPPKVGIQKGWEKEGGSSRHSREGENPEVH